MSEIESTKLLERALGKLSDVQFESQTEHFISAAILFHAIPIDGVVKDAETEALHRILMEDFDLTDEMVDRLVESARERDSQAEFFNRILNLANNELNASQKRNLISQLWEVVFSDGHLHEAEGNLVLQVGLDIGVDVEDACGLMTSNS